MYLLLALTLLAVALSALPGAPYRGLTSVNPNALLALASFMVASEMLGKSGFFHYVASKLERASLLALAPVAYLAGALLMNDAAMFVIVPIATVAGVDASGVSALAALINLGATITPFGTPQNVIVWLHYKLSFLSFLSLVPYTLFPAFLALVPLKGKLGRGVEVSLNAPLAALGLALIATSVIVVREGYAWLAVAVAIASYLAAFKSFPKVDLSLLATLGLMMYDFGIIGSMASLSFRGAEETFLAVAGLSQAISNVPATVIAVASGAPWKPTLLGADLGGLGTPIASLANLIAIKLAKCDVKEFTKTNLLLLLSALFWGSLLLALGL